MRQRQKLDVVPGETLRDSLKAAHLHIRFAWAEPVAPDQRWTPALV